MRSVAATNVAFESRQFATGSMIVVLTIIPTKHHALSTTNALQSNSNAKATNTAYPSSSDAMVNHSAKIRRMKSIVKRPSAISVRAVKFVWKKNRAITIADVWTVM